MMKNAWKASGAIFQICSGGDDPESQVYGENIEVREYKTRGRPAKNPKSEPDSDMSFSTDEAATGTATAEETVFFDPAQFYDQEHYRTSREDLLRAEENLRDVVGYFNERQARFTRNWMQSYIPALTHVQVQFRDVSRHHPAFSGRALRRVRQINELIVEIKQSVRK